MDNSNICPDLTPRSDNPVILKLHQERSRYETELKKLREELRKANDNLFHTRARLKEELIKSHQTEYDAFYNRLMNLKTIALITSEEYWRLKHNLLEKLRRREIDNSTYRKLLKEPGEKANQARVDVSDFFSSETERIFGEDKIFFNQDNLDK